MSRLELIEPPGLLLWSSALLFSLGSLLGRLEAQPQSQRVLSPPGYAEENTSVKNKKTVPGQPGPRPKPVSPQRTEPKASPDAFPLQNQQKPPQVPDPQNQPNPYPPSGQEPTAESKEQILVPPPLLPRQRPHAVLKPVKQPGPQSIRGHSPIRGLSEDVPEFENSFLPGYKELIRSQKITLPHEREKQGAVGSSQQEADQKTRSTKETLKRFIQGDWTDALPKKRTLINIAILIVLMAGLLLYRLRRRDHSR